MYRVESEIRVSRKLLTSTKNLPELTMRFQKVDVNVKAIRNSVKLGGKARVMTKRLGEGALLGCVRRTSR